MRIRLPLAVLLATAGLGCSSSDDSPGPGQPGTVPPTSVPTLSASSSGPCQHLTDGQGRALYAYDRDTASRSSCNGACATDWPAMLSPNSTPPNVNAPAQASMAGTPITRDDGTFQVSYGSHPLYTYRGDATAGETKGHCLDAQGGRWTLVQPDGSSCSCESAGGGGGGGGGGAGGGTPSDCGSYDVCGWTPGWRCWNNHQFRSACCWDAHDMSCTGSSDPHGGCGTYEVCGWTPGWKCWNNHQGRPSCCWNAHEPSCTG